MPPQRLPPQEFAQVIFVFIFLFYLYATPDQGPPPGFLSPHDYATERIERVRHSLDVLNTTKWQDFMPIQPNITGAQTKYLNLTGFREEDGYAWEKLDTFKTKSLAITEEAWRKWRHSSNVKDTLEGEIYENVTGIVQGRWVKVASDTKNEGDRMMNLTEIAPGVDWFYQYGQSWTRNITGLEGKLMLRLDEDAEDDMEYMRGVSNGSEAPHQFGSLLRKATATVTVQDESSSGDGWEMKVHGIHWVKQGHLLMTTTSEKFAGIFGLPHMATSLDYYASSQRYLNTTLEKVIERMEHAAWVDTLNPWSSSVDGQGEAIMPTPHCEYILSIQVHPTKMSLDNLLAAPAHMMQSIEDNLRFPDGASLGEVPKLQMSAVIFSPDCGFILESKGPPAYSPLDGDHLTGKKQEVFLQDVRTWLLLLAVVVFGQILLLKSQSKEASTPSTIGRVSMYTVAMMLMADGLLFASTSLLSSTAPSLFPSALLTSFAALMSLGFGVKFTGAIYNVQEPERLAQERAQQAVRATASAQATAALNTTAPAGAVSAAPNSTTPSAAPSNMPIIVPSDQDIDAEIGQAPNAPLLPTTNPTTTPAPVQRGVSDFAALYGQFILSLTAILFLSISSLSWPVALRSAYVHLLSFLYLSFWLPQIRRNVVRNCRKALLWRFVIGQSILRLLPFAYFSLKKDNILFAESDWKAFSVLTCWLWIQVWILVAQEVLGPRWGLPKGWTDEGWDYHPILREDNLESGGLPIGLMQTPSSPSIERSRTGEESSRKKSDAGLLLRTVDCAICMQLLEVPIVGSNDDTAGSPATAATTGGVTGMLARRQYMVTPCRHIFHSPCLEGWMRFRLQCPICRENLPPL